MAYSPLGRLLKILNKEDENEGNIYDDGSLWTLPESTTSNSKYYSPIKTSGLGGSVNIGLKDVPGSIKEEVVDPLEAGRNQINYYTKQIEGLGEEVKKPSVWNKLGSLGTDLLTRIGATYGAISNTLAGSVGEELKQIGETEQFIKDSGINEKLSDLGFKLERGSASTGMKYYASADTKALKGLTKEEKLARREQADKLVEEFHNSTKYANDKTAGGKEALDIFKAGAKSGVSTASGLFTGKYSDKNVDWGKVLEENRINPNETVSNFVKLTEAPGYLTAKALGADEESAKNWGNIVADLGISSLEGKITDVDGVGKVIKALRNSDKLDEIAKVSKIDDALKLAKKYNDYDDFVSSLGEKASKYSTNLCTRFS